MCLFVSLCVRTNPADFCYSKAGSAARRARSDHRLWPELDGERRPEASAIHRYPHQLLVCVSSI